jgi:pyruvate kinase
MLVTKNIVKNHYVIEKAAPMRRHRYTKILATLGPSSASKEIIEALFLEGADVFRLNFSHGTHETHQKNFELIRALSQKHHRPIGILMDLQGPKLRIGTFGAGSVKLEKGQKFRLDQDKTAGDEKRVCLPHPEIFKALKEGADLLVDDGKIRLKVEKFGQDFAETIVVVPGVISDRKGVNVPGVALPISSLTPKDKKDLDFGLSLGVDWVALSFVQRPEDILEAREIIKDKAFITSKIEKPQAIEHLDKIVELSDGVMVARGDLGVEMLPEEVPSLQKRIIRVCRRLGKPVIIATQMLDSMVHAPTPTRAEASDIATAVYDGVDGVMLSNESASGGYPVESVKMMNRIIQRTEQDPLYRDLLDASRSDPQATSSDAITAAARQVAQTVSASAIVTLTTSGSTTWRAARERPNAPIISLTPNPFISQALTLAWGTHPVVIDQLHSISVAMRRANDVVIKEGFGSVGDEVIITAGHHFDKSKEETVFESGSTRVLRIMTLEA